MTTAMASIRLSIRPFYGTPLAGGAGMRKPSTQALLCVVVTVLAPLAAAAQAPPEPPPRHEGSAEFAFVGTTGNASTQTIGLGGESTYRPAPWVWKNKAAFVRSKAESELKAQTLLFLTRAERDIRPRLAGFGEYGYFRDEFAGIDHRNSVAGGLTYKLIDLAAHLLSIDGAIGYLNEDRLDNENVSSATYGTGAAYRWKLSETATVTEEARFTGTFADGKDWRILQAVAVTARLTELLSLKVSNTVRYVNDPVPGFKATDTNTSIALVAKF
jgi:putative salt-induced outer membrane protein